MTPPGGNGNGLGRNPYDSTPSYDPTRSTTNFNPTTAVVIISLIGGCFILAFVSVIIRKCMRDDTIPSPAMTLSQSRSSPSAKPRGLDKAAVDALPLVHTEDLDERDERECPVCLTEFEPEDSLRLLPTCKHVFHQECIDAWFDSHSTCPLCRASLVGYVGSVTNTGEQGDPQEVGETITEVSESGDSDVELQRMSSVSPLEAAPQPSARISREGERSSARGTLSRNSQSFKRAARGVAAYEKRAASPAVPSSKNSSFRKNPLAPFPTTGIRRTSSLGADLIALRNLLMGGAGDNPHPPSYRLSTTRSAVPTVPVPKPSAPSTRARSMDLGSEVRGPSLRDSSKDQWVTIDLETGKASAPAAGLSSSKGASSSRGPALGAAPDQRTWSERFSLASLRGVIGKSSSDDASRLPV